MDKNQLIESYSPCCPRVALFEADENAAYFYISDISGDESIVINACFVANVKDMINAIPFDDWINSEIDGPPMVDYKHINHSENGMQFDENEENYDIVWTEDGTSAGLYYMGELIAYIPDWADREMPGYSRYVNDITEFAFPLKDAYGSISNKLKDAKAFWDSFDNEDWWSNLQEQYLTTLNNFMGETDKYYAIDGGDFPPKALMINKKDDLCYAMTLGVSILRLPLSEVYHQEQYKDFSRIELGFVCTEEYEEYVMAIAEEISGTASFPWNKCIPIGHGHTINSNAIPGYPAVWLINDNMLDKKQGPDFGKVYGDRVNLLWAIPLTQEEYDFLLGYDMEKLFAAKVSGDIVVFNGKKKNDIENLFKTIN